MCIELCTSNENNIYYIGTLKVIKYAKLYYLLFDFNIGTYLLYSFNQKKKNK